MDIQYYLYHFAHLHTAKFKGKSAPHKAVLLLAVMNLIGRGSIKSSEIELTDKLVEEFKKIWSERLPAACPFTCDISKPFFHMQHEPFWRLLEHKEEYWGVAEELGLYTEEKKSMPKGYSVSAMKEKFRCAKIDDHLFETFQNEERRKMIESLLVSKYMNYDQSLPPKIGITALMGITCLPSLLLPYAIVS